MKTAEDILKQKSGEIVFTQPETSIHNAVQKMVTARIGSLIVGDLQNITGIWTERDFYETAWTKPLT